jgi:hypothetical protein
MEFMFHVQPIKWAFGFEFFDFRIDFCLWKAGEVRVQSSILEKKSSIFKDLQKLI